MRLSLAALAVTPTGSRNLAIAAVALVATVPLWSGGSFALARYIVVLAYVMTAIGLNLAMGYAGEFVLGHPVIMGVAAYTAGILSARLGWPASLTIPSAAIAGVLIGILIMSPGLRVRGWYYSLITMFAVLVLPPVAVLAKDWTGGVDGLTGIKAFSLFGQRMPDWVMFEASLLFLALVWWGSDNFVRSGWGHRLRALRDARHAAEAAGIDLAETRLVVYVLSSIPAALAGAMLAYSTRFVGADMFAINVMLMLLTGVVLGGPGTRWGPVVGMAPLLFLSLWVGPFSPYNAVGLGVGLLVGTLVFPDGVMPAIASLLTGTGVRQRPIAETAHGSAEAAAPVKRPLARTAAHPKDYIVRAEGIVKRFGGNAALAGIEFRLRRGALVGLVGPNGSGKSTFLNTLSGFLRPDGGSIEIDGIDTAKLPVFRIARTGVGRTFQVPQLVEEFTAIENIEIGLVAAEPRSLMSALLRAPSIQLRAKARRELALAAFHLVGLPDGAMDEAVSKLPLGLKRVVEVGRAVVSAPKLLLLDEPAAGLNDEERDQLGRLLRRLRDDGISILVVEHDMRFLMNICEELVLLENGRVSCSAMLAEPLPTRLTDYLNYRPGGTDGTAA
jgi:ABC-type branched-subunit amino acid transport system ATPase component/ABC-type branched-subunit amino acid transport system permease subunit